ncbi:TIGR03790 family protein [Methylacidiphilales bacterium]|nr:TIGR03790 family protein [Candidatus Methylacidiphilales bacterium]
MRPVWCVTIFIWLFTAGFLMRGDDTDSSSSGNPPPHDPLVSPYLNSPQPLTNAATSSFLDNHPELTQPVPSDQGLSLHQTPPPENDSQPKPELSAPTLPSPDQDRQAENLVGHLLVVYNENDPDSKDLATYYAAQRQIAADHILSISCPTTEEISRSQYNDTIREPIISYMSQKSWIMRQNREVNYGNRTLDLLITTYNDIWAIVLIRGVPLKIANDPDDHDGMQTQPGMESNAAAVDSELSVLPTFGLPLGGCVPNPFFDGSMRELQRVGPESAKKLILVTRLDGPKPSDVRRMIDDSLYAEKNRLAGLAVIDTRGLTDVNDHYTEGDAWLRQARDLLAADGWVVKFDNKPDIIPATDPCNQVALYFGWYRQDAAGPWVTPPDRFVRGAIAYHLHSFSANTIRSETNNWVGPLIAHGATATMGMVYEPYLDLTPHIDIFTKRLLAGNSFAEAAYASERGLSWMVTVVGDPLYRPFHQPLDAALAKAGTIHSDHDDWLLLQKLQREIAAGTVTAQTDTLEHTLNLPEVGPVAEEGLGDLLETLRDPAAGPAAVKAYKKAMSLDTAPVDQIRVGLKLAQHFSDQGHNEQARTELKTLWELYPQDAPRFGIANPVAPVATLSPHSTPDAPPSISAPKVDSPPLILPDPSHPPGPPQPQP